ncbi:MAG TPA: permease-like cell division protein FtsX [Pseudogracilibacillus sp.]|nr:permease-like cell division protein FtsX [Pseudogracilibacillus sp.]
MKFRTFKRHIREGLKNIIRNGWMSIASIGAVTVTLFLVGAFVAIILNINQMANKVEEDVEIKVLLDLTVDEDDIQEISDELKSLSRVDSITFSSKEDELENLIEGLGEQGEAWSLVDQENPLNHAYIVDAKDPQDTEPLANEIEDMDNVHEVVYGEEVVSQLFKFNNYARTIGLVLIAGLVLTAVFLISNTIKLTIMARSTEIGVMKLVGATNGFIRWPFFVEGFLLGVLGSVIPIAAIAAGYRYLVSNISGQTGFYFVELLPYNPFVWQLSLIIVVFGGLIGMWGSVMSIRKFLKV